MAPTLAQKKLLTRFSIGITVLLILRHFFAPTEPRTEIKQHNVLERVIPSADRTLDVQRLPFLQARLGRDEREDMLSGWVQNGLRDYWERFQKPFIVSKESAHTDTQIVRSAIDDLLSLNGWVAAACPTLSRPFGQNKREDAYDDLISANHLYYIAIVLHSADHFLVDQLAVIVQLARRLGTRNIFVSMLDYNSDDATSTLLDLSEAVLTLLGVPFRIRRVGGMTDDPQAGYYPLEEAYARNLALEPLDELLQKRNLRFYRVLWLKGFTCPNDILETIKVSQANEAAMVCGMDWAEHNGFFIFSDRWRTRDMEGDQFRLSRSSSAPSAGPPRDKIGSSRYAAHLPFQVFCCESGTHVVDPAQSYYKGIHYRAANNYHNLSTTDPAPEWDPEGECMDSTQAYFCRDLWYEAARDGVGYRKNSGKRPWHAHDQDKEHQPALIKDQKIKEAKVDTTETTTTSEAVSETTETPDKPADGNVEKKVGDDAKNPNEADPPNFARRGPEGELRPGAAGKKGPSDGDEHAGSDFDAMNDEGAADPPPIDPANSRWSIPNADFNPARILVNPRCVTTYAGVSHTQLALDLFGMTKDEDMSDSGKFLLEDWEGAPDSFVCQEQRQTGGRKAIKTQRRLTFSVDEEQRKRRNKPESAP